MDTCTLWSRRSMLKASSFLVAAAAVAGPAVALDADAVPEVLTMLLAEYRDASSACAAARTAFHDAEHAFHRTLSRRRLPLPAVCAGSHGAPWLGHVYAGSVDPWTADHRLTNWRDDALLNPDNDLERIRQAYMGARQQLNSQLRKYRAIRKAHNLPVLVAAGEACETRVRNADVALQAYRPKSVAEIAEIVRTFRSAPSHRVGLEWTLAVMLGVEAAV